MQNAMRWLFAVVIAFLVVGAPIVRYRWVYTHSKRLREVTPRVFYRSGAMTTSGFKEAVDRYHIRTIVNLQDEYPDPDVDTGYFTLKTMKESKLCQSLGVRYVFIPPELVDPSVAAERRPQAIDQYLELLDDPSNYPILIHCKAGLHRTGIMTAIYRMEYQGWSRRQAIDEMKENGFGEWPCTSANDYIVQYLLTYQPGIRRATVATSGSSAQ